MTPEEARRALLAGEAVDWRAIDDMDVPEEDLLVADATIVALLGEPLPPRWQEGVARVLAASSATRRHDGFAELLQRIGGRLASIGDALPVWAMPFDVVAVPVRGASVGAEQRGHVSAVLETDTASYAVDVSILVSAGELTVDVVGVTDIEVAERVRVAVGSDVTSLVVLAPATVSSSYLVFETTWDGPLPTELVLVLT